MTGEPVPIQRPARPTGTVPPTPGAFYDAETLVPPTPPPPPPTDMDSTEALDD